MEDKILKLLTAGDMDDLVLGCHLVKSQDYISPNRLLISWMEKVIAEKWDMIVSRIPLAYTDELQVGFHDCGLLMYINKNNYQPFWYSGSVFIERYDMDGLLISCLHLNVVNFTEDKVTYLPTFQDCYFFNYEKLGFDKERYGIAECNMMSPVRSFLTQWIDD